MKPGNIKNMTTRILGISAFYHDSAAALVVDGTVVAAGQEERFTRKKHDPSFPTNAIEYCLSHYTETHGGVLSLKNLDAIVFYDKPFLKFERLLETYYAFAPRGLRQFLSSIPVWMKEKIFLKKLIYEELSKIEPVNRDTIKLLFSEHHLSHAASAYYPSPFDEAAVLTIDGVGEWATASIAHGKGGGLTILREMNFPHSLGLLYSAFTYYTGFSVNSGEYKLMGLAPYGDPTSPNVERYRKLILDNLVDVKDDGSIWLNQSYFDYAVGLKMANDRKWTTLFGIPPRNPETEISQEYCDMALAIQSITEEIVLKMAVEAQRLTGSRNLAMAGGVALNCVANGKILKAGVFDDLWIQPAAGDAGGALGAALAAYHLFMEKPRPKAKEYDRMQGSYLGPESPSHEIETMARQYNAVYDKLDEAKLCEGVAELIAKGFVVGWHQGRMEFGPRALGGRSILGDARNPEMQKKLNLKIKYRESFRPFAPSVLDEDVKTYFENPWRSPYMLLVTDVKANRRRPLPKGYHSMKLAEKLYYLRSDLPAITHLDYSARIQTVHKETNPRFHRLIKAFKKKTGYGVIVNTSFNVRGKPIVCAPEDSYKCFMRTEMDYLVIGDYLFDKTKQPKWHETIDWKRQYVLD